MDKTKSEDYIQKAKTIFNLLNQFRQNPRQLAKKLEILRAYLDLETNVLSEPNKIQIQMVEGDSVFVEAISFLKALSPLDPLEWDPNLALSAMEHVRDIGPKGLLSYQSSDGTEPEDRISKFGTFNESLGENIDFGPNDAIGVIISLTLDDGESQRPHRDNLFKADYHKIGIACGPHDSEFQMCVMDFAYDFYPLEEEEEEKTKSSNLLSDLNQYPQANDNKVNNTMDKSKGKASNSNASNSNDNKLIYMSKIDMLNNSDYGQQQSPLVKLSIEPDDFARINNNSNSNNNKKDSMQQQQQQPIQNDKQYKQPVMESKKGFDEIIADNNGNSNEMDDMTQEMNNIFNQLKVVSKTVEVTTKITYIYEDDSTKETVQSKSHTFKY